MTRLLITNGDSAVQSMREAGLAERFTLLPWRDALHWGRVPDTTDLTEVSDVRAVAMMAFAGDDPAWTVRRGFAKRDAHLIDHGAYETVTLWLEHDLYDQLQLVQILAALDALGRHEGVSLVQAEDHLGRLKGGALTALEALEAPVTRPMFAAARDAWEALSAPTPWPVHALAHADGSPLPLLPAALRRFLEDLPGADGLARSERQILRSVAETSQPLARHFADCRAMEEAEFEGDLGFLAWAQGLAFAPEPLLSGVADSTMPAGRDETPPVWQSMPALTGAGAAVLEGKADHIALNGLDRWWGGVALKGDRAWRYDADTSRLWVG